MTDHFETRDLAAGNVAIKGGVEHANRTDEQLPAETAVDIPSGFRLAIVSFLFNWPSTGGGIVHTIELAKFLSQAGCDVHLICPRFEPWGIGRVDEDCPVPVTQLPFTAAEWSLPTIQQRLRQAVDAWAPHAVLITDSWNIKPHLATAFADYPYFLRMQAQECLCPLNNLRLLPLGHELAQCPHHQLQSTDDCRRCLSERGHASGELHRLERTLSGVGTLEYDRILRRAFQNAESVLVLNPAISRLWTPHCRRVDVVTWGMDAARFPENPSPPRSIQDGHLRVLFAGVSEEPIKGFAVLHEAARRLWQQRQDFELVLTGEATSHLKEPFLRFAGWQSQAALPQLYAECDVCVVPTIAQDGLSRTTVEAMAAGRPVIGSRLGGLPYSIYNGVNGMLFEPGNVPDLCRKLSQLLDDSQLRFRIGQQGRQTFERRYTWDVVIRQQYAPLFQQVVQRCTPTVNR